MQVAGPGEPPQVMVSGFSEEPGTLWKGDRVAHVTLTLGPQAGGWRVTWMCAEAPSYECLTRFPGGGSGPLAVPPAGGTYRVDFDFAGAEWDRQAVAIRFDAPGIERVIIKAPVR